MSGTPTWNNGQIGKAVSLTVLAATNAFEGRDPKKVLAAMQNGEKFEQLIGVALDELMAYPTVIVDTNDRSEAEAQSAFMKEHFGLKLPRSLTTLAPLPDHRVLVVPKGLTPMMVVEASRKRGMRFELYGVNLDKDVRENERDPNRDGTYVIQVRDRKEADEELKNLSGNDLRKQNAKTMTLLERLLYGFKRFVETGEHLDVADITLCAGSRYSDGGVPRVSCSDGIVGVHWYSPSDALPFLGARAVVS